jgi:hypothetical protein
MAFKSKFITFLTYFLSHENGYMTFNSLQMTETSEIFIQTIFDLVYK